MSTLRKRWTRWTILAACLLAWMAFGIPADAQSQQPDPANPGGASPPPPPKPPSKNKTDSAISSAPDQPKYDPARADKDIDVGKFYMHKGDIDAAIDRFQDAVDSKPAYALPFRYLGEAQEKKRLKKEAVKSYTRYLDLDPHASDAAKIHKKIDKLWSEIEKQHKSAS